MCNDNILCSGALEMDLGGFLDGVGDEEESKFGETLEK